MWKYTIQVDGMMCGMCESHVNDAVRKAFPVKKVTSSRSKKETVVITEMELDQETLACFVGGTLFGSAGVKLLTSKDAKKAYTHITAAGLRMKDSVMETVTCVQENAADILASAKDINETRAAKEAETQVEDQEA